MPSHSLPLYVLPAPPGGSQGVRVLLGSPDVGVGWGPSEEALPHIAEKLDGKQHLTPGKVYLVFIFLMATSEQLFISPSEPAFSPPCRACQLVPEDSGGKCLVN